MCVNSAIPRILSQDELFLRKATLSCGLQQTFSQWMNAFILCRLCIIMFVHQSLGKFSLFEDILLLIFFLYCQVFIVGYFGPKISQKSFFEINWAQLIFIEIIKSFGIKWLNFSKNFYMHTQARYGILLFYYIIYRIFSYREH